MADQKEPLSFSSLGSCPVPASQYAQIVLGHGSGGRLSADLLQSVFLPAFDNPVLSALEDQAVLSSSDLSSNGSRLAFTTDGFVVKPLFFPGGDIGRLAVHGTVNDLAVGGAKPLFLSAAFILEEGLGLEDLSRIVQSMREACQESGVTLVTGDTKVVDKGKGDQVFIVTSGIGVVPPERSLSLNNVQPGDSILISGTMGDHGIAIMSLREGIEFETVLESDTASLADLIETMLAACPGIRWMRDPTRGGVSSALNEMASATKKGVELQEAALPIRPEVHAACEMLGLDPLYVANEGKLVAVVAQEEADRLLAVMKGHPRGREAAIIGKVVEPHPGMVTMKSVIGGERVVTLLSGEQLPRIC